MDETMESKPESLPSCTDIHDETMNDADQLMPQNPTSSTADSGSSDSDSDSDPEEDEAQLKQRIQTLESDISANLFNYDAHVQCIQLLRKIGDIEKLRKARETMSEMFPLSATMWQEWAKDETSLISGPEAFAAIEKLYERGVSDYLSVSLWFDYLQFIQEYDPSVRECSSAGISKARDLFERAVTAAGLHVAEGNKIWEAYREFEQAILYAFDETDVEAKEKQIQRIRSLFHRQLSVPLVNMISTLRAYKVWEVEQGNVLDVESSELDGISSHVASAYNRALEMYNARVEHEEQISRQDLSDLERLQQFKVYLKFEQSFGDPARVQVLYERAISDFPLSSDLWLEYARYVDETLKVGKIARNVLSRASRNCPCVGDVWVRYLLVLERAYASEKEIAAVYERSVQCTFSTLDEYLDLFLTRVDGLRRRISFAAEGEDVPDYTLIRETFQHASDYLSPHLKNTESLLHLYDYWAYLELTLGKDLAAARGVWESLLKICGSMLEAWKGYIRMEIELKNTKEARSIIRRCYSKRFQETGSEDICRFWLRFEREFGTLDDYYNALRKVNVRLEELQSFRLRQEREALLQQSAGEKRKLVADLSEEQSPAKRKKDAGQKQSKLPGKDKAKVQNLVEPAESENSKSRVDKPGGSNDQHTKSPEPAKAKAYNDQCTAFVSNVHLKANSENLRDFFGDVGGVVAVRILHDKFTGKSRGLAYVDFSDDARLSAAIAKNKQMLLGKKLSIARSDPKHRRKESAPHSAEGSENDESVSASKKPSAPQGQQPAGRARGSENVVLRGKNTFAAPRNVRALGWIDNRSKSEDQGDDKPKSNEEFRKMLIKK